MKSLLARLFSHLTTRRRVQLGLILFLVILASVAEAASIGAVIPFLGVLTAPQTVFNHPAVHPIIQGLGLDSADELVLPITLAFASAALFAGAVRLLLLWAMTRWSYATGADLSINIYRRTLYQPYTVHTTRNSSEVIAGISTKVNQVIFNLLQLLNLIGATFILLGILATLLMINTIAALSATIGFTVIYASIMWRIRDRLMVNSTKIAHESNQVIKSLQEGLGGIRDILLNGSQEIYCRQYRNSDLELRIAQGSNSFLSSSPRYFVESVSMLLIALLAYVMAKRSEGLDAAVPILGALALGAQRMLPAMQMGYAAWVSTRGAMESLKDTIELLEQPLPTHAGLPPAKPLDFFEKLELKNVSFKYPSSSDWILREINLKIEKGSRVGVIGVTGTGKSTLLDIVMGLLNPTEGTIIVDHEPISPQNQRHWQACIAHVPQTIYLSDNSVEENIAFGVDIHLIDRHQVHLAAKQANLHETIERWPDGYQTLVGERGVRLSGGQRQRIGIARALYKQAKFIIFDEATSALDRDTEEAVMNSIEALNSNLTIVMIAHRITTLKYCSQILEISNLEVRNLGTYEDCLQHISQA